MGVALGVVEPYMSGVGGVGFLLRAGRPPLGLFVERAEARVFVLLAGKFFSNFLQPVFQKIPRLIHQYLSKSPVKINEGFLAWRLKKMVASGVAEQQGEMVRLLVKAADEVSG